MAGFTSTTAVAVGVATTNPQYGYAMTRFTTGISGSDGTFAIVGTTSGLTISTSFSGLSTQINNKTYYLGQNFTQGLSNPEVTKYSGDIIYLDNRPAIKRSSNQKEDIKVILQF